jgi:hypothetical protein
VEGLEASISLLRLFFVEVRLCSWRRQMVVFSSGLWPLMVAAFLTGYECYFSLSGFDL